MSEYSAYFITSAGSIAGVQVIHSESDAEAMKTARDLLIEAKFPSVEVWDCRCCIAMIDLE